MNKEIKKYTEMFHNTYEMLAPKYGYETRGDTKQLDFDSPNGKLMYATIEKIVCPILEENQQLKDRLQQRDNIINKAREFINEYEKNRNCFKWNEQDYIDTINEIKEILNIDKGE